MDLGPYTVARPRGDGTHRVSFEVPKRIRGQDWPATIPLPLAGRSGKLDAAEQRAIRADAAYLYEQLLSKRDGAEPVEAHDWRRLQQLVEASTRYQGLALNSRQTYQQYWRHIVPDLSGDAELAPGRITESQVETYLRKWDHAPFAKSLTATAMRSLLRKAVKEGWRPPHLNVEVTVDKPVSKIFVWEQRDVDYFSGLCTQRGWDEIAALILTQWEIGQRLSDVAQFRYGEEYQEGIFWFKQSKTGNEVIIPAPDRLRALLDGRGGSGDYLFANHKDGEPFTPENLSSRFSYLRDFHGKAYTQRVCLGELRHACVIQLARAGCTVPQIISITGHSVARVQYILRHYLPPDHVCAWQAVQKREAMRLALEGARPNWVQPAQIENLSSDRATLLIELQALPSTAGVKELSNVIHLPEPPSVRASV